MGIVQRQSIQSSVITYAGTLLGYINLIYLFPIYLTPEQVGLTRVLIAVGVMFSQFSLLGVSYTLLRFFPHFKNKEEKHYGILTYSLLVSLVGYVLIGILFLLFKGVISNFYSRKSELFVQNYFYMYPIAFFLTVFEVLFFYARSLYKTVVPIFIREVVLRLLQTIALLFYILKIVDFYGFLALFVSAYLLHFVVIVFYLTYLRQMFWTARIRISEILPQRQLNRYGIFVYGTSIAAVYTSNIDVFMLGALAGLKDTAVYYIAFALAALVVIPSRTMNQVAIPIISEAWKDNDMKKLKLLYQQTAINQFIVGAFILLMIWINADLLLSFLPHTYADAKWPMLIIGFARLFDMATGANGEIILFSKHVKFNLAANIMLIAISTITLYFLIPIYGVIGAAISIPIAYVFFNVTRIIFLNAVYKMQPFTFNNVKVLLIFSVLFTATFFIPEGINLWLKSIGLSVIVAILFIVANLTLRTSDEIDALYHKLKSGIFKDILT